MQTTRLVFLRALAFWGTLLLALPVLAQQTGTLRGNAEDVNGAPVPGIKITLRGQPLIGGTREVLTDGSGEFRFVSLLPGRYAVTAEAKGFAKVVQDGLTVRLGETTSVTLLMEVQTGEEVIEVTAAGPIVDTRRVGTGQSLGDEFLQEVPSGRSYQDAANFVPGVVDNGSGNPTIFGGSSYSNQYLVDGVNTTDPSTNTFSLNFNYDAIEELQVITTGLSPEYGNVTGGVVNVVTKSGSNEFELDSSVYYTSDALMMQGLDESERDFSSLQANLNVGGPIVKDHLWYFVSAEYNQRNSQLPSDSPIPSLDGLKRPKREFQSIYWLTKLTYAPDPKNRFTLLAQGDPTTIDNTAQDPTSHPDAEEHQDQGGALYSLRWDGLFDPLVLKVQAAYKRSYLDIFPQARADGGGPWRMPGFFGFGRLSKKNDYGEVDGCLARDDRAEANRATFSANGCSGDAQADPSFGEGSTFDLDTGVLSGSTGSDYFILRERWQFTPTVSYFLEDTGGDHEIKLGADIALMSDEETHSYPGGASIFVTADTDGDGDPDPLRARVVSSDDNSLTTDNDGRIFAFFLMDTWTVADRVTLVPGVRVEKTTYDNFEGDPVLDFFTISPRFSFAVDPFGDGKTRVHGGYGRLYETGNLTMAKFVGKSLETRRALWDAEAGRYIESEDPSQQSIQGGASGTTIDKDNLDPMYTDEFQLGFERALSDVVSFDLTLVHRHTTNAWEDDEANLIWNQAGTNVIGSLDGTGQQVFRLKTNHGAERTYDGITASLFRTFADHWMFNGSYTLSWYRGSTSELLTRAYDNPRQIVYENGYLPDDHRHTIKAQGVYKWEFGLSVGASYLFETGGAYSKLYLNDYDGDYTNRRAPRGQEPGADPNDPSDDKNLRLPDFTRFDVRLGFDFEPLTGQRLEALVDLFNVLNLSGVTGVQQNVIEGTNFGEPTDRQQPFQAQLGLRYRY